MKITEENRDKIIEDYVDRIVDSMETGDLICLVQDMLTDQKQDYTNEELETEIRDYYPDLLGEEND